MAPEEFKEILDEHAEAYAEAISESIEYTGGSNVEIIKPLLTDLINDLVPIIISYKGPKEMHKQCQCTNMNKNKVLASIDSK